jgi:shikimate kinase
MKVTITGPRSVGKTTISKIVARELGLKYISADEIGEEVFHKQGGLNKAMKSGVVEESIKNGGYTMIIEIYEKKDNFLFDLSGGSFASKKMAEHTIKVRTAAKKNSIVIGLLPYPDKEKSVKLLYQRERNRSHFKDIGDKDLFDKTTKSYDNFPDTFKDFCHKIVYTEDKSPESVAKEIVSFVKGNNNV